MGLNDRIFGENHNTAITGLEALPFGHQSIYESLFLGLLNQSASASGQGAKDFLETEHIILVHTRAAEPAQSGGLPRLGHTGDGRNGKQVQTQQSEGGFRGAICRKIPQFVPKTHIPQLDTYVSAPKIELNSLFSFIKLPTHDLSH